MDVNISEDQIPVGHRPLRIHPCDVVGRRKVEGAGQRLGAERSLRLMDRL